MALNKVIIMGRITHTPEVKQTPNGIPVLQFSIAVDRYSKEEKQADFISCVAWRQTAEFIGRYFGKGRMIAITGNLHSRTYEDKNGTKHYVTEVYVESADFTGEPRAAQEAPQSVEPAPGYSYTPAKDAARQTGVQSVRTANGYPSQQMWAPKADKPAGNDTDYSEFEVFSSDDDSVPF